MIDSQTTDLMTYYYCSGTNKIKTDKLTSEFLSDIGTIVLRPINRPTVDQFEDLEELGKTVVNISGIFYLLDDFSESSIGKS